MLLITYITELINIGNLSRTVIKIDDETHVMSSNTIFGILLDYENEKDTDII